MTDIDKLCTEVGSYGKFQKIMLWCILFPIFVANGFASYNQIFMDVTPNHWCRVPQLEFLKDTEASRLLSIPFKQGTSDYENCLKYEVNWTEIVEKTPNSSWPVQSCTDGWEYNKTQVPSSIVIDFDLVCDKKMYATYGLVFFNLGGPLGIFCFGLLCDRFGRKLSLLVCLIVSTLGNILTAFSQNIYFWIFARMLVGTTVPALYQISFIFALEIVGKKYRTFVSVTSSLIFTFSLMALSGITYLIPDWKYMAMTTSVPFSAYLLIICFIPESPRWLMARNRHTEGFRVLKNIAKINRKTIPDSLIHVTVCKEMEPLDENSILKTKEINILDLFRFPNMRTKTIIVSFNWFVNEVVYIGLNWYTPNFGSGIHFSFFLAALVEIPACIISKFTMDRWGRKWAYFVPMLLCSSLCVVTFFVPPESPYLLVLVLISKFAITSSFLILYTYAGELYPTDARGLGLATSSYFGGIGRSVLPFITNLGTQMMTLPLLLLGILSTFATIFALRLPETRNKSLPQTISEGEEFGKKLTFKNCWKS